ncbi:hypothetical protein [Rhabdaerophilum sp. SD176]|uniref:hypothetical protein n=1 Tax=Rhabdaerophilum sp. SD176 TaxID=2983548 RepID=UPI0024DFE912|nr:hypothetical protein [Rhabdaerophilum sp. SD176]
MSEPTPILASLATPAPARDAAPAHGHTHSHDHAHPHGHAHAGHRHAPIKIPTLRRERADPPRFSLMALSAGQRLLLAVPPVALLWALTLWAMRDG